MPKRARSEGSLTGGLGDVNPAFLSSSVTQSAGSTATTQTIQTPVSVVGDRGQSEIMEIFKIFWYFDSPPLATAASGAQELNAYLSTKNFGATEPSLKQGDAQVFASASLLQSSLQVTAAGEIETFFAQPIVHDLTDSAGHGFLVATNNVYLQIGSATTVAATGTVRVKILYRIKKVNQAQLMAILLSQNQG